jgi:tRNA-guanine family transglycosylase
MAGEILSLRLLTLHNIYFYLELMARAREHIADKSYLSWKTTVCAGMQAANNQEEPTTQANAQGVING